MDTRSFVDLDYPRHVRLSSNKKIVSEIQDEMRRDILFRHSLPERFSRENCVLLEKVYRPNRVTKKKNAEKELHTFLREEGVYDEEPEVLEKELLENIYGRVPPRRHASNMTREQIKHMDRMKELRDYPHNLAMRLSFTSSNHIFSEKSKDFMQMNEKLKLRLGYKENSVQNVIREAI